MANQTTEPTTAGPERIAFEVARLEQSDSGRVEVEGRWFGVRGRRFVRPTLTLIVDGAEQRYLADLEQKPWAAEDGEDWLAVFPVETKLGKASEVELSVAPDIAVKLADGGRPASPRRRRPTAAILRAPRIRTDAGAPRPALTERAQEIDRLNSRLIAAGQALERERAVRAAAGEQLEREHARVAAANDEVERERARRTAVTEELEQERSEALRLRAQVGKLQAELDLARAAQVDDDVGAQLDEVRRALDEERSAGKRLRSQLAEARETAVRARESAAAAGGHAERSTRAERAPRAERTAPAESPARPESPTQAKQTARAESHAEPAPPEAPDPTRRFVPVERSERSPRRAPPAPDHASGRTQTAPRPDRPLNPSLRHRTYWLGRVLVVLLMLAVIAAIVLVIRSTHALPL